MRLNSHRQDVRLQKGAAFVQATNQPLLGTSLSRILLILHISAADREIRLKRGGGRVLAAGSATDQAISSLPQTV